MIRLMLDHLRELYPTKDMFINTMFERFEKEERINLSYHVWVDNEIDIKFEYLAELQGFVNSIKQTNDVIHKANTIVKDVR